MWMDHSQLWVKPSGEVDHTRRPTGQLHLSVGHVLIAFVNAIDLEGG